VSKNPQTFLSPSKQKLTITLESHSQIDLDSTGRLPKSTVLTALSSGANNSSPSGKYTYDQVRETLKTVSVDSSGQVELEDFVDLVDKLKGGAGSSAGQVLRGGALSGLMGSPAKAGSPSQASGGGASASGGKVLVKGSNTNITHSINEDERTEFTRHINQVRSNSSFNRWKMLTRSSRTGPHWRRRHRRSTPYSNRHFPNL